jgi:methyl-accepting chemotaxis protein
MRFIVGWLQQSRWSIRTKLMGGFAIISLFLGIITLLSIVTISELGNKITAVAEAQTEVTNAKIVAESARDLENSLPSLRENLLTIDLINNSILRGEAPLDASQRVQPYLANIQRQRAEIDQTIANATSFSTTFAMVNTPNFDYQKFRQLLQGDFVALLGKVDQLRAYASGRQFQQAADTWKELTSQFDQILDQIKQFRITTNQVVNQLTEVSRRTSQEADATRNQAQVWLAVAGGLAIVVALGFGMLLTYAFTSPLQRLRSRFMQLAEGDLITNLEVSNRDEYGELATTFNQSVGRLGSVIEQFQSQALRVSSAAAQIAAASRQAALISADQAGAVAEATVTIEELSHTAQQIAEAATLVANAAEQALSSASDGQDTVRTSIHGISTLKTQVQDIAIKILALSERSQRVGHIIEQITSIADQTHLLALNAAIESAAAGENGKRFAVVAAEVKKLSERSRNATKEVQAVLSEIQGATNASVMATEQGMKEAERGVALAHKSGDANESIIQMVERTVQLANAISLATQQQRSASEQVVSSMRQLATVIQDGAASAKQSSSLAIALDEIASELRRLSSQFRVEKSSLLDEPGEGFAADGGSLDGAGDSLAATKTLFVNNAASDSDGDFSGPGKF